MPRMALHDAVRYPSVNAEQILALIEAGATLDPLDRDGRTPYEVATALHRAADLIALLPSPTPKPSLVNN